MTTHGAYTLNSINHTDLFTLCDGLPDASVDMILCDLPYGTTACAWDTVIPFEPMWERFKRVIKPRGAIVLTASQPFTSALVMSNPGMFRHEWIWDKKRATGGANAAIAPMKAHESVLVFSKQAAQYNPQMGNWENIALMRKKPAFVAKSQTHSHGDYYAAGRDEKVARGRYPDSLLRIPALGSWDSERTGHPTQKPVALFRYLIRTYTQPGELVLDPCVGSGTTALAAREEGRTYICGDSSAEYVEVAQKRLDAPYTLNMFNSAAEAQP